MKKYKLYLGDNMQSLKKLPDNSIDSIVSDPPYALTPSKGAKAGFMGKLWDAEVPTVEFWKEVYRVLKPGGHILSFGGTRTYHRMVVNIEDAGFEIRDQIQWIYGSGFPKSLNIGKAVDKMEGNEREVVGKLENYQDKRGLNGQANVMENAKPRIDIDITKGQSEWEGWGTALKPANEPICLARKPLSEKSVAENVLKWKTGGINVDGCRIGYTEGSHPRDMYGESYMKSGHGSASNELQKMSGSERNGVYVNDEGRFPANIIFECICDEVIKGEKNDVKKGNPGGSTFGGGKMSDVSLYQVPITSSDIHTNPDCPCYILDQQSEGSSRFFYNAKVSKAERNMGLDDFEEKVSMKWNGTDGHRGVGDYYPDGSERPKTSYKNTHPTVKPVALMTYLCRLITPPNGIILDPFMGSGSTGIASQLEGFRFVGMEMDEEYFKIATKRIEEWEKYKKFVK